MAEFIAYAPYGNYVLPGYVTTDPDATARFALIAGDAGLATSIGQSGGVVAVDEFGGANMTASSGAFIGVDSFANISLNTSNTASAQIVLTSQSTISMTTTTGSIYLGAGGGDPGANVDIFNAGTIQFDALGYGAITGVQTINGAVYPPPGGGGTSITQAGGLVACLGNGAVTISSIGVGADVEVYNAGTIRFDTFGAGAIENISTINGSAYPPPSSVPADLTVSTLTAGSYVSTSALQGVSSIVCALDFLLTGSNTAIVGSNFASLLDAGGAGVNVVGGEVRLQGYGYGVKVEGDMNVSTLSGVSTINGISWPLTSIGDTANTFVYANGTYVALGYNNNAALIVDTGNNITVGSVTANTSVVYASTIQASADGLNIFEPVGGASVYLNTSGEVQLNAGLSAITDGNGITVGLEGSAIYFPLDPTGLISLGAINNVSTINGVAYPQTVKQATYYNSVAQNLTSGNTDLSFDSTGAWNNAGGYITHTNGTTNFTVVQTGLYQLEFTASILANGATWTTTLKSIGIDITRSPIAEQAIIGQSANIVTTTNYGQNVSATFYLVAGDVINLRISNTYASGTPTAPGVLNTFDLNNFFSWRYIS